MGISASTMTVCQSGDPQGFFKLSLTTLEAVFYCVWKQFCWAITALTGDKILIILHFDVFVSRVQ